MYSINELIIKKYERIESYESQCLELPYYLQEERNECEKAFREIVNKERKQKEAREEYERMKARERKLQKEEERKLQKEKEEYERMKANEKDERKQIIKIISTFSEPKLNKLIDYIIFKVNNLKSKNMKESSSTKTNQILDDKQYYKQQKMIIYNSWIQQLKEKRIVIKYTNEFLIFINNWLDYINKY